MYVLYQGHSRVVCRWTCVTYMSVWDCAGLCLFFFQAEDGIRDLVRSRGLGDVYKRQMKFRS